MREMCAEKLKQNKRNKTPFNWTAAAGFCLKSKIKPIDENELNTKHQNDKI